MKFNIEMHHMKLSGYYTTIIFVSFIKYSQFIELHTKTLTHRSRPCYVIRVRQTLPHKIIFTIEDKGFIRWNFVAGVWFHRKT